MACARISVRSIAAFGAVLAVTALSASPAQGAPVLAAAGDIACSPGRTVTATECNQATTAALIANANPTAVAALGDTQYESATFDEYTGSGAFNDTWGKLTAPIYPAPGNHEYQTNGASGYFKYFGARAGDLGLGYYSYDLPGWHVISLNSNCSDSGCSPSSAGEVTTTEVGWLKSDLAAHTGVCTLAYWHHPLFTGSSRVPASPKVAPLWKALYDARADLVLAGHAHSYERFAPQDASGVATSAGIREFVVGTGGEDRHQLASNGPVPNREASDDTHFGALFLTLHANSYEWTFNSTTGSLLDQGGPVACHAQPPLPRQGNVATTQPALPPPWTWPAVAQPLPFAGVTLGSKKVKIGRRWTVHIEIGCPADSVGNCVGVDTLTTLGKSRVGRATSKHEKRQVGLGSGRFSIRPGTRGSVTIALSRATRSLFKRRRSLVAAQTAVARESSGTYKRTTAVLKIRRP